MNRLIKWYIAVKEWERGASAVEYAILVTVIALVIIAGATALGLAINGKFNTAVAALT